MPILEKHLTQVVKKIENILIILTINIILTVFKFWTIGGIFLYMFSDALLFDMMLNTAFEDGIDTIQELIDMDIRLGKYSR